jgi:hypothetical protein
MESHRWLKLVAVVMVPLRGLRLTGQPAAEVDFAEDIHPLFQTPRRQPTFRRDSPIPVGTGFQVAGSTQMILGTGAPPSTPVHSGKKQDGDGIIG